MMSDLVSLVTALIVLIILVLLCCMGIAVGFGVWMLKNVGNHGDLTAKMNLHVFS